MSLTLCNLPSSSATTTIKPTSPIQRLQHKPRSTVSFFSSPQCERHALPFSPPTHHSARLSSTRTYALNSNSVTSCYPTVETVEHIVLFKMKPNTDLDMLIKELNKLKELPGVIYISAGYTFDFYSSNPSLDYPIFLHSRHRNRQDLDNYMHNPVKAKFTATYTELYYEDYAVMDFPTYHVQPLDNPTVGNALRCTFFEMTDEGWGVVQDKVEAALGESALQRTFGGNYVGRTYRPQRQGFDMSSIGIYPGVFEMQSVGDAETFGKKVKGELPSAINNIMVVDYIIKEVYVTSNYGVL